MTVVCRRQFALLAGRSFQGILAAVSACVLRAGAILRFSRVAMKFHGGVPAGSGDSAGIFEGFNAARARAVRNRRAHEGGAPGGSGVPRPGIGVPPVVKRLLRELGAPRPLCGRGGAAGASAGFQGPRGALSERGVRAFMSRALGAKKFGTSGAVSGRACRV